jgi:hypothetical protein
MIGYAALCVVVGVLGSPATGGGGALVLLTVRATRGNSVG